MDDARFPWIILVPRRAGIAEFHDLDDGDRVLLSGEIALASRLVKSWAHQRGGCDKLNVAMIGNIVPQLHAHIVARTRSDSAWPYPVWGRGEPLRYSADSRKAAVAELVLLFDKSQPHPV